MHLRAMMRDGVRIAVKSRPEIGPDDTGKEDSDERVSGSVGGSDDAGRLIELAKLIASLSSEQIDALRKVRDIRR